MSASEELALALTRSLQDEPERWKTRDYGKPYLVHDSCERDDGVQVMGEFECPSRVRIQGVGEWGTIVRVNGEAEAKLRNAMRALHAARNEERAAAALKGLRTP